MTPGETRARRKIREAAETHGFEIDEMEYEPIGPMVEMSGFGGGWVVEIKGYGVATGYNWRDVVEMIHAKASPWLDGSLFG